LSIYLIAAPHLLLKLLVTLRQFESAHRPVQAGISRLNLHAHEHAGRSACNLQGGCRFANACNGKVRPPGMKRILMVHFVRPDKNAAREGFQAEAREHGFRWAFYKKL